MPSAKSDRSSNSRYSRHHAHSWRFVAASPVREVFAVMEQAIGTWPYRFEVVAEGEARSVEIARKGFFGQWSKRVRNPHWIGCRADQGGAGTVVEVAVSRGAAARSRGLMLVQLLTRGTSDTTTVYRNRIIRPGPVTLVASWAGTPYHLYVEPRQDARRGPPAYTATSMVAISGQLGAFLKVRLGDGTEGYVERDQVVAAPEVATRDAQEESARFG